MILKTSPYLCFEQVGDDQVAVWNRYAPKPVYIDKNTFGFINKLKNNTENLQHLSGNLIPIRYLIKNDILVTQNTVDKKKEFKETFQKTLLKLNRNMDDIREKKLPYKFLTIFNQRCNLNCPYCIVSYNKSRQNNDHNLKEKSDKEQVLDVVDRFINRDSDDVKQCIHFNGGEFLLEFDTIKQVVDFVKKKGKKIYFSMNTNATLLDDAKARYINKNIQSINVSIDGYESYNNTTRKYHAGSGAFSDIMAGIENLNKYRKKKLDFFQGTINDDKKFNPEMVQEMQKYGFKRARLGVNLMGITAEKAQELARMHIKMVLQTKNKKVKITDSYFKMLYALKWDSTVLKNSQNHLGVLHCNGLSRAAGRALYLNVDTNTLNLLCSYIPDIAQSVTAINGDIHHDSIFNKASDFINKRYEHLLSTCADCDVIMLCRTGCVMEGITSFNQLNPAACAYKKEIWKCFLKNVVQ